MRGQNSLGRLREGAWKMMEQLVEGPKTFSELRDGTGLSHTAVAVYLREFASFLVREQRTRKYRLAWRPPFDETDYTAWELTELRDVQQAARYVDAIMEADLSKDARFDLLGGYLTGVLGFLSANILLNISTTVREEEAFDALKGVGSLTREYVTPLIGFLTMYCWAHGPDLGVWLKDVAADLLDEARETFNPVVVADLVRELGEQGSLAPLRLEPEGEPGSRGAVPGGWTL